MRVFSHVIPRKAISSEADKHTSGEHLAYIPHMFEGYSKQKVDDQLKNRRYAEYCLWGERNEKNPLSSPGRVNEKVYPDIAIKVKCGKSSLVACIDAKVKESSKRSYTDKYEMITYIEAMKRKKRQSRPS